VCSVVGDSGAGIGMYSICLGDNLASHFCSTASTVLYCGSLYGQLSHDLGILEFFVMAVVYVDRFHLLGKR
jgi:hypothetical protein